MAIYSLSHKTVGKSTHQPGTAGAHIRYITRVGAARVIIGARMPSSRDQARTWFDQAEAADRKNGRVCDKVMVALPRELDVDQRAELVREFAQEVTHDRAPWIAAIHDKGKDAANPHAHIVIRDKDPGTGKRVAGLSEKGSTEMLRETWERMANRALERAGQSARIDRRTLAAQGVDRKAQIHVGPKALAMEARGVRPESENRQSHGRVIRYPEIDGPMQKTRAEHNAEIILLAHARNVPKAEAPKKVPEAAAAADSVEAIIAADPALAAAVEKYDAKRAQEAQERRDREKQAQEAEATKKAMAQARSAAADRYEALLKVAAVAEKRAAPVTYQAAEWTRQHPWRTRLHRMGLIKAKPLLEIEAKVAAAKAAKDALAADQEGRAAWAERKTAAEALQAVQRKSAQKARQEAQKKAPSRNLSKGRDDFGMGF